MSKLLRGFCTGLAFILMGLPAHAIESSNGLKVDVGAFFPSLDTVIRGDNDVTVDFETDLSLDNTDTQKHIYTRSFNLAFRQGLSFFQSGLSYQ